MKAAETYLLKLFHDCFSEDLKMSKCTHAPGLDLRGDRFRFPALC